MRLLFTLTALPLLFLAAQEILRRAGKWLTWGLFIGLPTVLTPYWFQHNTDVEVFPWVM